MGTPATISKPASVLCSELGVISSNKVDVNVVLPSLALSRVVNVVTALSGGLVSYTLTLKNTGSGMASHCSIRLSTLSVSLGGLISRNSCSWNLGSVAPGAAIQVTVKAKVDQHIVLGVITNVAQATCDGLNRPISSNGVSVNIGPL